YAVGPALLWSPFIVTIHLIGCVLRMGVDPGALSPLTGYEFRYIAAITLGTNFYALLGLIALYSLSRRYFGPQNGFISVVGIWFGTSYIYYLYSEPSYAHVLGASLTALFVWSYIAYHSRMEWGLLLRTSILAGLMVLTRWQNAVFFIIPFMDMV